MRIRTVSKPEPLRLCYRALVNSCVYKWIGQEGYYLKAENCLVALDRDGKIWVNSFFTEGSGQGATFISVEAELVVQSPF